MGRQRVFGANADGSSPVARPRQEDKLKGKKHMMNKIEEYFLSRDHWELAQELGICYSLGQESEEGLPECQESVEFTQKTLAIFLSEISRSSSEETTQIDVEFTSRLAFMLACVLENPSQDQLEQARGLLGEYRRLRKQAARELFIEDSTFSARIKPNEIIDLSPVFIPQNILRNKFLNEKN